MQKNDELTAIDLFSGCGGISAGLKQAGFRVIAGVDIWESALTTYRANFPNAKAINADISILRARTFMRDLGLRKGELFALVGGPPCQGFSKNVPRRQRYLEDSRNRLVRSFLDYAEALLPALVVMENVAEFKNGFDQAYTSEIQERLGSLGYHVDHAVLAAHDFGVPQRRRRAFFIATKYQIASALPTPTHSEPSPDLTFFPKKTHVSVWDAIGDLPTLKHGESYDDGEYSLDPFSEFQRRVRQRSKRVSNHVARKLQPTQFARLSSLQPGQGIKDLPASIRPKSGYSGAYGRLTKTMIAPTITRWVFHPGSGRFGHPVDIRLITMREAARLQGFLDDFSFTGTYIGQAHQIGNAVPPILTEAIARHLRKQLAV